MSVTDQLIKNTEAFIRVVEQVSESVWSKHPSPDIWSVAKVMEHVYQSEFGIPRLFTGNVRVDADTLLAYLEASLAGFTQKTQAPGVTKPKDAPKPLSGLIQKFGKNRQQLTALTKELSLQEIYLGYKYPIFGNLARLEWLHFMVLHAQRHLFQIKQSKQQVQS